MAYPQQPYSQSMFQQQPSYYQNGYLQQLNNIPIGLRGRPVSSIEEVRASMIDFDGTTFYFPDAAKKSIYTKRMNLDGTASLETYRLVETPVEPVSAPADADYVTQELFEKTVRDILAQIDILKKGETQNDATAAISNVTTKPVEQFNF